MNDLLKWIGGGIMLASVAGMIICLPYYPKREMKKINKRLSGYSNKEQIPEGKVEQLFEEFARDSSRRYIRVILFFIVFALGFGMVYFS